MCWQSDAQEQHPPPSPSPAPLGSSLCCSCLVAAFSPSSPLSLSWMDRLFLRLQALVYDILTSRKCVGIRGLGVRLLLTSNIPLAPLPPRPTHPVIIIYWRVVLWELYLSPPQFPAIIITVTDIIMIIIIVKIKWIALAQYLTHFLGEHTALYKYRDKSTDANTVTNLQMPVQWQIHRCQYSDKSTDADTVTNPQMPIQWQIYRCQYSDKSTDANTVTNLQMPIQWQIHRCQYSDKSTDADHTPCTNCNHVPTQARHDYGKHKCVDVL